MSPILTAVRRRWPIAVAFLVLVPLAFMFFSLSSPSVYRSTAKVLVSDRDLAGSVSGVPDQGYYVGNLATEAQIAGLQTVIAKAKGSLGNPTSPPATTAAVRLKIASTPGSADASNVLLVEADSNNPYYSQRLATVMASGYVAFRRDLATREIRAARNQLSNKVQELRSEGSTNTALYNDLQSRLQELDTLLILGSSRASFLEGGSGAWRVSPQPVRSLVIGILAGLLLGVIAAVAFDRLDRRLRSHDDIGATVGLPVLGTLPDPKRRDGLPSLVARTDLTSPAAEAFRTLRTHMKFALATSGGRSMLITSASPGEGKSFVATNLGLSAASAGDDVVLVDCDLRKPAAHRYLGLPSSPGLSDVVAGEVSLKEALIEVPLPDHASGTGRLRLLPAGRRVPNPGEFIASAAVADALRQLTGTDETMTAASRKALPGLVILDTPPLLPVSDATALATVVDATVVVIRADSAKRTLLERLRGLLASGAHRPVGIVLTASWSRRGGGYGQPYEYYGTAEGDEGDAPVPVATPRASDVRI